MDINDDFTVCAWIDAKAAPGAVFAKSRTGTDYVFSLTIHGSGKAAAFIHDAGPNIGAFIKSTTTVANTGWHHVCKKHDSAAKELTLWVDGKLEGSISTAALKTTSNNVKPYIGDREQGDCDFNGSIDEVMIFKHALTKKQIEDLYNSCK